MYVAFALRALMDQSSTTDAASRVQSELSRIAGVLQDPFALQNIVSWLLIHGLKIAVILFLMLFLRWITRISAHRLAILIDGASARESATDRENRMRTLSAVFRGSTAAVIWVGGGLMILQELDISVTPLLGGAAIIGAATCPFAFSSANSNDVGILSLQRAIMAIVFRTVNQIRPAD